MYINIYISNHDDDACIAVILHFTLANHPYLVLVPVAWLGLDYAFS